MSLETDGQRDSRMTGGGGECAEQPYHPLPSTEPACLTVVPVGGGHVLWLRESWFRGRFREKPRGDEQLLLLPILSYLDPGARVGARRRCGWEAQGSRQA